MENETEATEFILLGLSSDPLLQLVLFVIFLLIYLITLFGNLVIILAIRVDPHLHIPMYSFLSHLAFLDITFSSVTVPKMLENFLTERQRISVHGCFTQVFFVMCHSVGEGLLLTVMAYDRYIAICFPLQHMVIMNKQVCAWLIYSALFVGFLFALLNIFLMLNLHFCGPIVIHHFSCEAPQLFKLSCSNTLINEVMMFTVGSLLGVGSLFIILASYVHIISAVLRIQSREGKRKAFSTCTSHVIIVVLYYGAIFFRYLKPSSKHLQDQEMAPSIVYCITTPMLNPVIYSLRNQELKTAVFKMMCRKIKDENM